MATRFCVLVCEGPTCGQQRGSAALRTHFKQAVTARGLQEAVFVGRETCFGYCQRGPNVLVYPVEEAPDRPPGFDTPGAVMYSRMTPSDADRVVERHLGEGQIVWAFVGRPDLRD